MHFPAFPPQIPLSHQPIPLPTYCLLSFFIFSHHTQFAAYMHTGVAPYPLSTGNLTVATITEKHDYPSGCHQPPIVSLARDRAL